MPNGYNRAAEGYSRFRREGDGTASPSNVVTEATGAYSGREEAEKRWA